jgi:hypothetical protein
VKLRLALASLIAAGAAVALPAAAAHADTIPGGSSAPPPAQVLATSGFVQPSVESVAAPPAAPTTGSLPFTGGDVAGLTVIGLALVGGGTVLVRRGRVRSEDNS